MLLRRAHMVYPHVSIVRSALTFVERREGPYSPGILAANAACIVAAVVQVNLWTLVCIATSIAPQVESVVTPMRALALAGITLLVSFHLARREAAKMADSHARASPRTIVLYAIVSLVVLLASAALLATV
jgi:hypothetical protein